MITYVLTSRVVTICTCSCKSFLALDFITYISLNRLNAYLTSSRPSAPVFSLKHLA